METHEPFPIVTVQSENSANTHGHTVTSSCQHEDTPCFLATSWTKTKGSINSRRLETDRKLQNVPLTDVMLLSNHRRPTAGSESSRRRGVDLKTLLVPFVSLPRINLSGFQLTVESSSICFELALDELYNWSKKITNQSKHAVFQPIRTQKQS